MATIVGAHLTRAVPSAIWIQAAAVTWLLAAAGNSFNDSFDEAVDTINRPRRPIPSGRLTACAARVLAHVCATAALILALPLGLLSAVGTVTAVLLLYGYTLWLRNVPLVGNAIVATLSGMAVVYGGIVGQQVAAAWWVATLVFLFMFSREVLKTVPDEAGDRSVGIRTVTTVWGPGLAMRVGRWVGGLMVVLPAAVWLVTPMLSARVLGVAIVYYAGVGYGVLRLWRNPGRTTAKQIITASKAWGIALLLMMLSL